MESKIGGQISPTQNRAAQNICKFIVADTAILTFS